MDILPSSAELRPPSAYASWLGDFAARGLVPQFLALAVPSAIFFGLLSGVRAMSLAVGVASGLFFGLFFGGTMTVLVHHRMRPLRSLSSYDRREVASLVRRGDTAVPPRLAPAVITYCNIIRRGQSSPQTIQRMNGMLVVLGGLVLLGALVHPRFGELVADAAVAGLLFNRVRNGPRRRENVFGNAAATERAASALVHT